MAFETLAFFERDPSALPLYEAFRDALLARHPGAQIKIQKTQISFTDGCGFAFVSHPPRKAPGGVLVSLGLPARLDSARVFAASEPYPGRWTHHFILRGPEEIDGEFLDWLDAAHEFAVERYARRHRR